MIAVDTNLLVYAHRAAAPEHLEARAAIEAAAASGRGWGVPLPCVAEFWSVVTHPSSAGGPSTARQAAAFLDRLADDGGCRYWSPDDDLRGRLMRAAERTRVQGARIYDLQIGLIALQHGATEIWTHDAAFLAPPGLEVVDPL